MKQMRASALSPSSRLRTLRLLAVGACAASIFTATSAGPAFAQDPTDPSCPPSAQAAGLCTPGSKPGSKEELIPPQSGSTNDFLSRADPLVLSNQEELGRFKSWILDQPGIYESGFVESASFAEQRAMTVMWAGASDAQEVLKSEAAQRGLKLTFQQVRFSKAAQREAGKRITERKAEFKEAGFELGGVAGSTLERDGLLVVGRLEKDPMGRPDELRRTQIKDSLKAVSPAVIDVEFTDDLPVPAVTRGTDSAPYNSGGAMRDVSAGADHCSSGFAVWWNGAARTTTARHCGGDYHPDQAPTTGTYGVGLANGVQSGAKILSSGGYFWMFDGAWNDPNGYKKTVTGLYEPNLNDMLCTSGAATGVHCNVQVTNTSFMWDDGQGFIETMVGIQTAANSADIAAGTGDSGGPVLWPNPDNGWTTVEAAGMIQWVSLPIACQSVRWAGTGCGKIVGFTPMALILDDLNATLRFASP